jgi:lysyl-tRNA synthetase class 2
VELANGYHELCEPIELRDRFEAENRARIANGKNRMPVDELLLAATGHGIESCAGVAMGVDRLLMALGDEDSLQEVINFPWDRA